jgi:hypothetical protein
MDNELLDYLIVWAKCERESNDIDIINQAKQEYEETCR